MDEKRPVDEFKKGREEKKGHDDQNDNRCHQHKKEKG
jgi:hypothetical protein